MLVTAAQKKQQIITGLKQFALLFFILSWSGSAVHGYRYWCERENTDGMVIASQIFMVNRIYMRECYFTVLFPINKHQYKLSDHYKLYFNQSCPAQGKTITVHYDATNPGNASTRSFVETFLFYGLMLGFSMVLWLIAIFITRSE